MLLEVKIMSMFYKWKILRLCQSPLFYQKQKAPKMMQIMHLPYIMYLFEEKQ